MKGRSLGQFFTPTPIKKLFMKLINPTVRKSGKFKTVFDFTCGTGGFLIEYIKYVQQIAK